MFNQGGYEWKLEDNKERTECTFRLAVPKFMDTSSLVVDVQPLYIRVEVKDKVTQILWPDEMMVDDAKIQRSQTSGDLCITCRRTNADVLDAKAKKNKEWREDREKKKQLDKLALE